jgi:hypothetical protein
MVLVAAIQFTRNLVTGTTCANAVGASALNHEVRKDSVKRKSVVESALCEFNKVGNSARRICMVELNMHVAFFGVDDCFFHAAKLTRKKGLNRKGAKNAAFLSLRTLRPAVKKNEYYSLRTAALN